MQNSSKSKQGLTARLQKAAANIHVDVFGYEKSVTQNMVSYFHKLSAETGIPSKELVIRIFNNGLCLRICVYRHGALAKEISIGEFITIFTNTPSHFLGMNTQVAQSIMELLQDWDQAYELQDGKVQFCIVTDTQRVRVNAYGNNGYLGELPLKNLIKKFTS